jgi:hypothetical protein
LSRHDPNNPDDPPPSGDPENGMPYDGSVKGATGEGPKGQLHDDMVNLSQTAVSCTWLSPWPAVAIDCILVVGTCSLIVSFILDILGDFTLTSFSVQSQFLDAASDSDIELSINSVLGITRIAQLTLEAKIAYKAAQFFATFGKLPGANVGFGIALGIYVVSSTLLIWTIYDSYIAGVSTRMEAFVALVSIGIFLGFDGNSLSRESKLWTVWRHFSKWETNPINFMHDIFFDLAKTFVMALAFGYAFRIITT